MFERLRKYWSDLERGSPGSRFEEQHDKQRRKHKRGVGRALRIIAGVILMPIGLFFLAVPGPGLLIMGIGAVLVAREFRFAAKALDRIEVRGRQVFKWSTHRWQRLVRAARRSLVRNT